MEILIIMGIIGYFTIIGMLLSLTTGIQDPFLAIGSMFLLFVVGIGLPLGIIVSITS